MKLTKLALVIGSLMVMMLLIGCGEKQAEPAKPDMPAASSHAGGTGKYFNTSGAMPEMGGQTYTVAGVTFTAPSHWKDEGTTSMRKAQLATGPDEGDTDSATVVVFYFGPDQGGNVAANINRWIGQMGQPDGGNSADVANQFTTEFGGMKASVVEVTGTYASGGMGMAPQVNKEGYLMVAVVLEGPEGSLFFKLTGPEKTASRMAGEFAHVMESVAKASM